MRPPAIRGLWWGSVKAIDIKKYFVNCTEILRYQARVEGTTWSSSKWKPSRCVFLNSPGSLEGAWIGWAWEKCWKAPETLRFLLFHPPQCGKQKLPPWPPTSPWKMPCPTWTCWKSCPSLTSSHASNPRLPPSCTRLSPPRAPGPDGGGWDQEFWGSPERICPEGRGKWDACI